LRERSLSFNAEGVEGPGERPGSWRKPRLTEAERRQVIALAKGPPVREQLEVRPRVHLVFVPTGACRLSLQESWWRLFRREAFAGQKFANGDEID
jgi:hypothetical protein